MSVHVCVCVYTNVCIYTYMLYAHISAMPSVLHEPVRANPLGPSKPTSMERELLLPVESERD